MNVEKQVEEIVLGYLKAAEGRSRIMSPQDIAKLVREVGHKGAMLGYVAGMKLTQRTQNKELEIAELSVKELTERVKQLETELIAQQQ